MRNAASATEAMMLNLNAEIDAFMQGDKKKRRPSAPSASKKWMAKAEKPVHRIVLAVRPKRIAHNVLFEFESARLSRLEVKIEAAKAAREAGYPIVGYVHSFEKI